VLAREKGRKPHFCIVGGFDIDFDGNVDARGAAAVAALVERWGGVIVDSVDATTDYLVMGSEPALSEPKLPTAASKPAAKAKAAEPPKEEAAEEPAAEGTEEKPAAEEGAEEQPADDKATEGPAEKSAELPRIEKAVETDLTAEPRTRRVSTDRDKYEDAIRRAEKFAIPRLPADRFFNFVGLESSMAAARVLQQ